MQKEFGGGRYHDVCLMLRIVRVRAHAQLCVRYVAALGRSSSNGKPMTDFQAYVRLASKSLAHRFCLSDRIEENLKSQFLPLLQRVGEVVVKANKMMPRACC